MRNATNYRLISAFQSVDHKLRHALSTIIKPVASIPFSMVLNHVSLVAA